MPELGEKRRFNLCQPLPVYPHQQTSSERCARSGLCKKRRSRELQMQRQAAARTTDADPAFAGTSAQNFGEPRQWTALAHCPISHQARGGGIHAATVRGRARSIRLRSRGECIACQRSVRRCTLSQKSGLLPNTRARMRAVAAVTLRRSLHSSLTCLRCTPMASASALRQPDRLHEFLDQNFADRRGLAFCHQHGLPHS
jgi:hypothetical protein